MILFLILINLTTRFNRYQASDLVKLDILLNAQPVDAMATIVHKSKAQRVGRELVEKLKKFIDRSVDWNSCEYVPFLIFFLSCLYGSPYRQMFEITIQAAIGSKVVARET